MKPTDFRDLVIETLADSEAELRDQVGELVDLVADLAFENVVLRHVAAREMVERIQTEGALNRIRRRLRESRRDDHQAAA